MARDPYRYFRVEARELTDQIQRNVLELERTGEREIISRILRLAHTLKGAARVVRLTGIAERAHLIEGRLTPFRDAGASTSPEAIADLLLQLDAITGELAALEGTAEAATARGATQTPAGAPIVPSVDTSDLQRLQRGLDAAVGELATFGTVASELAGLRSLADRVADQIKREGFARNTTQRITSATDKLQVLIARIERSVQATQARTARELAELRRAVQQLQLVPAASMTAVLERTARDAAQLLGKSVSFTLNDLEVRLEPAVLRIVQDVMVQFVRNAVAHGIEESAARRALPKPPDGRITTSIFRRGGRVCFRCEDDGGGIDVAALRSADTRSGKSSEDDLASLLLRGGVSTSTSVSEASGRGIGMDIVRDGLSRLSGNMTVGTERGLGSWFEISFMPALSAVTCLIVECREGRAALALSGVAGSQRIRDADIQNGAEGPVLVAENEGLPLLSLRRALAPAVREATPGRFALIVRAGERRIALSVDRIVEITDLVVRPLPDLAPADPQIEAMTYGPDGRPLLVLSPMGLLQHAAIRKGQASEATHDSAPLLVVDDSLTTRMLEQSILESAGYEVDLAVSAEEGLERVRQRKYGLILVDVEMPGMDGFGFVETLRSEPGTRHIPAILVTSRNADDDRRRGVEVGAQDYVVKSEFDQAALLRRIRELVA